MPQEQAFLMFYHLTRQLKIILAKNIKVTVLLRYWNVFRPHQNRLTPLNISSYYLRPQDQA